MELTALQDDFLLNAYGHESLTIIEFSPEALVDQFLDDIVDQDSDDTYSLAESEVATWLLHASQDDFQLNSAEQ